MKNKKYIGSENNLQLIKQEIDEIIFDEKDWISGKMWKIAEVTYSYYSENDFNLNTTLFCDIGGADLKEIKNSFPEKREETIGEAKEVLVEKINKKLAKIKIYLEKVQNLKPKSKKEKYEIDIISNALKEKIYLLNYCLNGIPYELEKAGIKVSYDCEEIDKKQRKIDKKVFGGQVKENPEEIIMSYENSKELFEENKNNLTSEEKERFLAYLQKIEDLLPKDYAYKRKNKPKSLLEEYKDVKIADSNYIPGFNLFIEAFNGLDYVALQNDEVGSISDGPNSIEFPNNEKFKSLLLPRFLKLNAHEIETHSITDHNHKEIIGNLRGAKSIEKDEGLAIFMELMLEYGNKLFKKDEKTGKIIIDKQKIILPENFSNILFGEILKNDELLDYLQIKEKLKHQKTSPETIYLRLKRSNNTGVQHKDCSYTRGLLRLVEEVNNYIISDGKKGIKFEDLFLGKISFEEVKKLKYIKKVKQKQEDFDIIEPLFASDAVLYFLEQRKYGKKIDEEGFLKKLEKKYPILDFSKQHIKLVRHNTKRNLNSVFNILYSNINGKNENFILMLENSIRRLGEKRKEETMKFLGTES